MVPLIKSDSFITKPVPVLIYIYSRDLISIIFCSMLTSYHFASIVYLTFLFYIYIGQNHYTIQMQFLLLHPYSFMVFQFRVLYMTWCLTLYHYCINCWTLSIFTYFNFAPILFYYSHTLLSFDQFQAKII